jgi:hypothetical protein
VASVDGDFDQCQKVYDDTPPQMAGNERAQRFEEIRTELADKQKLVNPIRQRIEKARGTLEKEWNTYPKEVREDSKLKEFASRVTDAINAIGQTLVKLDKVEREGNELMRKVQK